MTDKTPELALAEAVLAQAQRQDQQCAFWFISALSKLATHDENMTVRDVFGFACMAMPDAATKWIEYVKRT